VSWASGIGASGAISRRAPGYRWLNPEGEAGLWLHGEELVLLSGEGAWAGLLGVSAALR
jgi:hypothetical protein